MATGDHTADHRKRHDGVDDDPAHQPGPVRVLTKDGAELPPITPSGHRRNEPGRYEQTPPRRKQVGPSDEQIAAREAAKKALDAAGALSFDEQKEQVRRANSILLSRVLHKIETGIAEEGEDLTAQLAKCSSIAKQWAAEERQAGGASDPDDVAALQRQAKKAL